MWLDGVFAVYWGLVVLLIGLRTWRDIHGFFLRIQAERRHEILLAEIAEEDRLHPPPPYDPARAEARRVELVASGWKEGPPGVFTKSAHPKERARLQTLAQRSDP